MRKHYDKLRSLAFSSTAKDTYILFSGNVGSAFLGFLYTLLVARALSVEEFGVFSAAVNLIIILFSITDVGISSGIVRFVSESLARGKERLAEKYIKTGYVIRYSTAIAVALLVALFAQSVSTNLLATTDKNVAYWVSAISLGVVSWIFSPYILQAQKRFAAAVFQDISLGVTRLAITAYLFYFAKLTMSGGFMAYFAGTMVAMAVNAYLIKLKFLRLKPKKKEYVSLLKFSGWLGVNRVISAISGRLDIQMLAIFLGATATGLYSIPSRLASFVIVLTASFSSVLAPRLSSFEDRSKEKSYILKATLVTLPIIAGIVFWIIVAEPFIVLLFGDKYLPAVPIFQALVAAMIPFVLTAPSVTAITYSMKKTVYIGMFSFFQLAAIFTANMIFIPKFGVFGPTITIGIVNTILAIYSWVIVIRYYWVEK